MASIRTSAARTAARNVLALAAAGLLLSAQPGAAQAPRSTAPGSGTAAAERGANPAGRYFTVDGLRMYYEVHGAGRPLVLIHGALSTIDVDFGGVIPGFARGRRVIAVEQQAHGRTADNGKPLSYERMADETAAVLRHLGVDSADVFGYSMGAGVALQMAVRHPSRVRKLVLAAPATSRDGFHPGILDGIAALKPEHLAGSPFERAYAAVAPNPGAWPTLIEKVKRFDGEFQGWPAATVRSVTAPTLIVVGDADVVRPEHAVELFRLRGGGVAGDVVGLPDARLAVLPGTTHVSLVHRADWLMSMISEFLDAPAAKTATPQPASPTSR